MLRSEEKKKERGDGENAVISNNNRSFRRVYNAFLSVDVFVLLILMETDSQRERRNVERKSSSFVKSPFSSFPFTLSSPPPPASTSSSLPP